MNAINMPLDIPPGFVLGVALVAAPIVLIVALLRLAGYVQRTRAQATAHQIALTDAVHRQVGALVAPVVRKPLLGPWEVVIPVPLHRPEVVGRVLGIVNEALTRIDARMSRHVHIVLTPQEGGR